MKRIKYILTLFCLSLANVTVLAEQEGLIQQMQTVEAQVFPPGNLFREHISNVALWSRLLNELQNYISSAHNQKMNRIFRQCKRISQQLIETIRWGGHWILSPSISSGNVYENYLSAKNNIEKLKTEQKYLRQEVEMLQNQYNRRMASQVLLQFILLLDRLIERAMFDLDAIGKRLRPSYLFYSG